MLMGFGYWTKASAFWSLDYCSILLICTQTLPLGLFHVFEDTWDAWMIIHASQTLAGVLNLAGPPLLGLLASRLATVLLILAKCPSSSSLCPPGWTPALWCLSWEHLLSLEPLPLLLLQLGERALAQLIPLHQCLPLNHVNHLQNPSVPGIYSMKDCDNWYVSSVLPLHTAGLSFLQNSGIPESYTMPEILHLQSVTLFLER